MINLGPNAGRIMGVLAEEGGEVLPSDLRARHDFTHPPVPTDAPPEFRADISAVQNIDQGIRELEAYDLVEYGRNGAVKVLRLTDRGRELLS